MSTEKPNTRPAPPQTFPLKSEVGYEEEFIVPIAFHRVQTAAVVVPEAGGGSSVMASATYALNAPCMKAPIKIGIGIPLPEFERLQSENVDGMRASICVELAKQMLQNADVGARGAAPVTLAEAFDRFSKILATTIPNALKDRAYYEALNDVNREIAAACGLPVLVGVRDFGVARATGDDPERPS